jgi:hypothetical protein
MTWRIGRPLFYSPWPRRLPTSRDWIWLLLGLLVLVFAFKQYIKIGEEAGWEVALWVLVTDAWRGVKESWHG